MTQDELKEAVLAALLDYETLKKTRRTKAIKKALQRTVMATVIGSTGITGANNGRSNQASAADPVLASDHNVPTTDIKPPQDIWKDKVIWGAVYFGVDQYKLTSAGQEQLKRLAKQLPRFSELTVIGCTDSTGEAPHNEKIGKLRAHTVANFLSLQGLKIKTINNVISKNRQAGWIARRVDIIVNSSAPTQVKHPALQGDHQTALKITPPGLDYPDQKPKTPEDTANRVSSGNTESLHAKASPNPARLLEKAEWPVSHRTTVRGVVHFAFEQHSLNLIHKERLAELIKQLPKDAEVTVIGRTDNYGDDQYNKILGMQRAKSVAIFLANQGFKIKAVGGKVAKTGEFGWKARRVDIIVDSNDSMLEIKLPELAHARTHHPKPRHKIHSRLISSIFGKKPSVDDKDVEQWKQRAQQLLESQLK